jgi:hypothetical protein
MVGLCFLGRITGRPKNAKRFSFLGHYPRPSGLKEENGKDGIL